LKAIVFVTALAYLQHNETQNSSIGIKADDGWLWERYIMVIVEPKNFMVDLTFDCFVTTRSLLLEGGWVTQRVIVT